VDSTHPDTQGLAAADDARHTAALHTVMGRVTRFLGEQTDWVSQGAVTRSVTGKLRRDLPDALLALLDNGTVERRKVERAAQSVIQYRMRAS